MFCRKLILASASPRRRGYLHQLGYQFEVVIPDTVERPQDGECATEYVVRNAREKAALIAAQVAEDNAVVIAADTVVVLDGRIMEKPDGTEGAFEMLRSLSGNTHEVISGVCVQGVAPNGEERIIGFSVTTQVVFRHLPDAEIMAYIESGEPMDKAGAYAIQGRAAYMIERIVGSYTNVVGLPLSELVEVLSSDFDIHPTFHGAAGA